MKTEKVNVGEIAGDCWWNVILVNLFEDELNVVLLSWCSFFDKGDE